jgi:hypothetical protein
MDKVRIAHNILVGKSQCILYRRDDNNIIILREVEIEFDWLKIRSRGELT